MNETSDSAEDATILEITQELCQQLEFKFRPAGVQWAAIDPRARQYSPPMPADQCAFRRNRVYLPRSMKNKLEPHEWKPLLASSLIYQYDRGLRLRLNLAPFVTVLGPPYPVSCRAGSGNSSSGVRSFCRSICGR